MNNYTYGSVAEAHGPDIDLFSSKPVNSGVLSREYVTYRAKTRITEGAPIDIDIKTGMRYADLSKSKFCVVLEIVKEDGSDIVAGELISHYFPNDESLEDYSESKSKRSKRQASNAETSNAETSNAETPNAETPNAEKDTSEIAPQVQD